MSLSVAERTLWQDMSGDNKYKEISKSQRETRTKEIRQGAVAYVEQHAEDFDGAKLHFLIRNHHFLSQIPFFFKKIDLPALKK